MSRCTISIRTNKDADISACHFGNGFDVGADDYVVKPFRIRELLARVKRTLQKKAEFDRVYSHENNVKKMILVFLKNLLYNGSQSTVHLHHPVVKQN